MDGVLTYIYHKINPNVGKYATHVGKWMHTQEYVKLTVSYVSTDGPQTLHGSKVKTYTPCNLSCSQSWITATFPQIRVNSEQCLNHVQKNQLQWTHITPTSTNN